jgi:hypothetical protein
VVSSHHVSFEVLTSLSTKIAVLWDMTPCILDFLLMEAVWFSESSVDLYRPI